MSLRHYQHSTNTPRQGYLPLSDPIVACLPALVFPRFVSGRVAERWVHGGLSIRWLRVRVPSPSLSPVAVKGRRRLPFLDMARTCALTGPGSARLYDWPLSAIIPPCRPSQRGCLKSPGTSQSPGPSHNPDQNLGSTPGPMRDSLYVHNVQRRLFFKNSLQTDCS